MLTFNEFLLEQKKKLTDKEIKENNILEIIRVCCELECDIPLMLSISHCETGGTFKSDVVNGTKVGIFQIGLIYLKDYNDEVRKKNPKLEKRWQKRYWKINEVCMRNNFIF